MSASRLSFSRALAGDLNDFQFGEPGEGSVHPVAILEGGEGEVPHTNDGGPARGRDGRAAF